MKYHCKMIFSILLLISFSALSQGGGEPEFVKCKLVEGKAYPVSDLNRHLTDIVPKDFNGDGTCDLILVYHTEDNGWLRFFEYSEVDEGTLFEYEVSRNVRLVVDLPHHVDEYEVMSEGVVLKYGNVDGEVVEDVFLRIVTESQKVEVQVE